MNTQTILDHMILVLLNINYWSGRKGLNVADIEINGIDIDTLPQGAIKNLENMMVISPAALKIFHSVKREALSLCQKYGLYFGCDGYLMPKGTIDDVLLELKRLKGVFDATQDGFLAEFEQKVAQWLHESPAEYVSVLRSLVAASRGVHADIYFNYAALEVKAPDNVSTNRLDEKVGNLYGELCSEVREDARSAYEYYFVGRKEITRKTLRPLKAIRAKLGGLIFLHPSIEETIQIIDDTLNRLPKSGAITGADLNMVAGLLGRQLATMGQSELITQQHRELSEEIDEVIQTEPVPEQVGTVAPITWDF